MTTNEGCEGYDGKAALGMGLVCVILTALSIALISVYPWLTIAYAGGIYIWHKRKDSLKPPAR